MMFGLIKDVFVTLLSFQGSLSEVTKVPYRKKCIFFNNQQYMPGSTLTDLNPNKHFRGLRYD